MQSMNDIQVRIRDVKHEEGFEGWRVRLLVLCERSERLEEEIAERKLRWDHQKEIPGMEFYRKLNEANIKAVASLLKKTRSEIHYVIGVMGEIYGEKKPEQQHNSITPEMIERARLYPLENIIEIKRGLAQCISGSHKDSHPSMDTRNNFAYCYSCNYSGDSLDVYQKVNGCDFVTAVRALQ